MFSPFSCSTLRQKMYYNHTLNSNNVFHTLHSVLYPSSVLVEVWNTPQLIIVRILVLSVLTCLVTLFAFYYGSNPEVPERAWQLRLCGAENVSILAAKALVVNVLATDPFFSSMF